MRLANFIEPILDTVYGRDCRNYSSCNTSSDIPDKPVHKVMVKQRENNRKRTTEFYGKTRNQQEIE